MSYNSYSNALDAIIHTLKKHTGLQDIDVQSSFLLLGIGSLNGAKLVLDINFALNASLKIHDLFLYPTPHKLAGFLAGKTQETAAAQKLFLNKKRHSEHEPIAIVAMDCKYPGARDCDEFWQNCANAKETVSFFNSDPLSKLNDDANACKVYARGTLDDIESFDAQFFNYSVREAQLSDPQHRLFIEAAWNALEKAGYSSNDKIHQKVGVYASMNDSTYIVDQHALQNPQINLTDRFALQRTMSSQFLATKVAYLLNCTGPSITVQAACSSSLVAIVLACQQLASFECDMAIAGGVSIVTPQDRPYFYQEGNIYSPDGRCRPFDANAQGTVFSNGLGVVILKRLSEAVRDRDHIVSVIKGYSSNNDGSHKMSYAAPSMQGQLDCILSAQAMAGVEANSIQFVEAHGTGTLVGDPIEIEALTRAFRKSTTKEQFCAVGSVKANIGHTHVAAGVAGLIKASLALKHQKIPPALHFESPNPNIDFMRSPFYVNTRLLHWRKSSSPRRAAVSAFGVGGTNAHIILEEAPVVTPSAEGCRSYPLLLSAKSKQALEDYNDKLISFMENQSEDERMSVSLADIAYTLQVGRNEYAYRTGIVCKNISDALNQLKIHRDRLKSSKLDPVTQQKKVAFLFPGQGSQYVNMSHGLYRTEPLFREWLDKCLSLASQYTDVVLYDILFSEKKDMDFESLKLSDTQYVHPILFSVEFALAQLLQSWDIKPDMMLGHSLGEYVAACLAGVFSLEDAIHIVCARGAAIAQCHKGAMLSVPLSSSNVTPLCTGSVSIAVKISPNLCVLSGSTTDIEATEKNITHAYSSNPISIKRLKNSHPFHTMLLAEAAEPFLTVLQACKKNAPKIPYLSNLTGGWVSETEVLSDQYWIDHMLQTVQLSKCIGNLLEDYKDTIFIEVGPKRTLLSSLQMNAKDPLKLVGTLSDSMSYSAGYGDDETVSTLLKSLWCYGCVINWKQFYAHENRHRVPLPTYPFQKQRFWIDQTCYGMKQGTTSNVVSKPDLAFYTPSWICDSKRKEGLTTLLNNQVKHCWIIFANGSDLCKKTCELLVDNGEKIVNIFQDKDKAIAKPADYIIDITKKSQYEHIFENIIDETISHYAIIHFWGVDETTEQNNKNLSDTEILYQGLYSGIFISQSLSQFASNVAISWSIVTTGVSCVSGNEKIEPLKSGVLSLCRVLPLESQNPDFHISHFDVDLLMGSDSLNDYSIRIINHSVDNLFKKGSQANSDINTIACRNGKFWIPSYLNINLPIAQPFEEVSFDNSNVYLITGGLGGMGLTTVEWLSNKNHDATVILISRSQFPQKHMWQDWLATRPAEDITSKKIKILQRITEKGCRIEVLQADVADYKQMKEVTILIEKKFGPVNGIFHLAGVSGKGLTGLKEINEVENVFHPKVQGLQTLINLFRNKKLEFFIASSSLTAIAGGVGQIDYCAANIYLDFCLRQNPFIYCKRSLVINWNAWRSVGMATNVKHTTHCYLYAGNSITPEKGMLVLEQLLNCSYNQVIVSRFSPKNEIERIKKTFPMPQINKVQNSSTLFSKIKQYSVQDIVTSAWKNILGVDVIDEQSSFYDYGGDSLALIQLVALLEKSANIKVTLQELVQHLKFNKMVELIKTHTQDKEPINI